MSTKTTESDRIRGKMNNLEDPLFGESSVAPIFTAASGARADMTSNPYHPATDDDWNYDASTEAPMGKKCGDDATDTQTAIKIPGRSDQFDPYRAV